MKAALVVSASAQLYNGLIGLLILPVYLHILGEEAFGLIGFFYVLQAMVQLLDFGITPAFSREIALFRAGSRTTAQVWGQLRLIEILFFALSLTVVLIVFLANDWIAVHWFNPDAMTTRSVSMCLLLMTCASLLRWCCGVYRAGLIGLERHRIVNLLLLGSSTVRFVFVVPVIYFADARVEFFFAYQLVVSLAELLLTRSICYRALPSGSAKIDLHLANYRDEMAFALKIGLLSAIWLATTQADRFVLSSTLSLGDYGEYSLAVMAASVFLFGLPVLNQVVQPRMTILLSRRDNDELVKLYRLATRVISALVAAVGGMMVLEANSIFYLWTGAAEFSTPVATIFSVYVIANCLALILAPPYLLQFAHGDVSLHLRFNTVTLLVIIPVIVMAAIYVGPVAVALSIALARLVALIVWMPIVNRRFLPELTYAWTIRDVLFTVLVTLAVLFALTFFRDRDQHELSGLVMSIFAAATAFFAGLMSSREIREAFWLRVGRKRRQ